MTIRVIIPVKAAANGKTRLAPVLGAVARQRLIRAMLARVVAAARAARSVDQICLLGPSRLGQSGGLRLIADPGLGLNSALTAALAQCHDVCRAIILPADLPQLTARDIERLAVAPGDTALIAPDRHGTGTNALSLPLPLARNFAFAFGTSSFALHKLEALRLGLKLETIASSTLACDIDVPDDLPDATDCLEHQFE